MRSPQYHKRCHLGETSLCEGNFTKPGQFYLSLYGEEGHPRDGQLQDSAAEQGQTHDPLAAEPLR